MINIAETLAKRPLRTLTSTKAEAPLETKESPGNMPPGNCGFLLGFPVNHPSKRAPTEPRKEKHATARRVFQAFTSAAAGEPLPIRASRAMTSWSTANKLPYSMFERTDKAKIRTISASDVVNLQLGTPYFAEARRHVPKGTGQHGTYNRTEAVSDSPSEALEDLLEPSGRPGVSGVPWVPT